MQNENKNNFASYVVFVKALFLPRISEPLIPATQPTRYDTQRVVSYDSNHQMAHNNAHCSCDSQLTKKMGALCAVINDDSGRFFKYFVGGFVHV